MQEIYPKRLKFCCARFFSFHLGRGGTRRKLIPLMTLCVTPE